MKLSTLTITLIFCLVSTTFAYDYIIEDGWTAGLTLQNNDTLLMTGGGMDDLTLYHTNTSAIIQDTSPLGEGIGGVWHILVAGHLNVSGGEIHMIDIDYDGTATLSGGLIEQLWSSQLVAPDPHIEIICRAHSWDALTNILTGTWADDTTFNIRLFNQTPYTPVINNIEFTIVPEPFSLLLFAAGGTLLTRRRR
jgi:hypothetical protein